MGVPGSNLLKQAMKAIKPTTIKYVKFNGRTQDALRNWVDQYSLPTDLRASVQAILAFIKSTGTPLKSLSIILLSQL